MKSVENFSVSAANTSPGSDRVEYRHLKRFEPSCSILPLLFDHCFKRRDVPPAWKSAITVLIDKKGSTEDPSNFRPIALMSCLQLIQKRLTFNNLKPQPLSAQGMIDVAYLEPRNGQIPNKLAVLYIVSVYLMFWHCYNVKFRSFRL